MLFLLLHATIMFLFSVLWVLTDAPKHPYYKLAEIRIFFMVSFISLLLYLCIIFDSALGELQILWIFFIIHGVYMVSCLYILSAYYTKALSNPITLSIGVIFVWIALFVLLLVNINLIILGNTSKIIIAVFSCILSTIILFRFLQLGSRLSMYAISLKLLYLIIFTFYFVIWLSVCFSSSVKTDARHYNTVYHNKETTNVISISDRYSPESSISGGNVDADIIHTTSTTSGKNETDTKSFSNELRDNHESTVSHSSPSDTIRESFVDDREKIKSFTSVVIVIFQIVDVSFIFLFCIVILKT